MFSRFFLYYILIEWFGNYKPYFTKKAKKSQNSCKPLCSIELRRAGRGRAALSACHTITYVNFQQGYAYPYRGTHQKRHA